MHVAIDLQDSSARLVNLLLSYVYVCINISFDPFPLKTKMLALNLGCKYNYSLISIVLINAQYKTIKLSDGIIKLQTFLSTYFIHIYKILE